MVGSPFALLSRRETFRLGGAAAALAGVGTANSYAMEDTTVPHIIVEATPKLAHLDFVALFTLMHRRIAGNGEAVLDDFKSRVYVTDHHLAGEDRQAEFIVARLVTTNPRPKTEQRAMAQEIHDVLRMAVEKHNPSFWWQVCVLIEPFEKQDYIKTDSKAAH